MKVSVEFVVRLPFIIKKEGKYFVSCCPVFDIWSQGETNRRAQENLVEAVRFFLIDCFERGTLDKVLKDCGFIPLKKPIKTREISAQKEIRVPLPFMIDQNLNQCQG